MKSRSLIISLSILSVIAILSIFIYRVLKPTNAGQDFLFQLIPSDSSKVFFSNDIVVSDSVNIFNYQYMYNGGGVGVADFNNDGLADLFFAGNMVPCRTYLNEGNFRFHDITETAGIKIDKGWVFGVSVVDINQDGWADLYLSIGGPGNKNIYPNKLFINQGCRRDSPPTFKEMSAEYGLADSSQSIQSLFFDYDRDGDLDMYQLIGGGFDRSTIIPYRIQKDVSAKNADKLYRNDADPKLLHPVFKDVSLQAGIIHEGFGLGVSLTDINEDGWPDIYISNDYLTSDLLYVNNCNGGFSEGAGKYFKHTSHFAMGNDVGDINNDGLADYFTVDMLPNDHYQRTLMFGPNQYDQFYYSVRQGYAYQYMRNTLQLNRGNGLFSEIGQLAGVYKSGWSWSPLFADLDNDGYQDIFITNGFVKNITDLDFVSFRSNISNSLNKRKANATLMDSLSVRPGIKPHPFVYRNNHDYTFEDVSERWGFLMPFYSNGAAYADLDNDGDLDLISSNLDAHAAIYRNTTMEKNQMAFSHYLRIKLSGPPSNKQAIGAKVVLKCDNDVQIRNMSVVRGFESSVEDVIHFGLGKRQVIDSLFVYWPDGKLSLINAIKANQTLLIDHSMANGSGMYQPANKNRTLFKELRAADFSITYRNRPNLFNDFNYDRLIPRKYSEAGPSIAVGDINGDGMEDFYVGGSYLQSGEIYRQHKNGTFGRHTLDESNQWAEDAGCLFFDADGDGDQDLYVVGVGNDITANKKKYQDRLYKNDGTGKFTIDRSGLPKISGSGSCVTAADYDQDNDLDLFVGGSIIHGAYPQTSSSYLLRNDKGRFTDVTDQIAPSLRQAGMVNASLWTDIDNDNLLDLFIVGDWMPLTVFRNTGKGFINFTVGAGLNNTEGWWQSVVSGDFDNDGDMDFIGGNWGLNNPYRASMAEPMRLSYKDFDNNNSYDPILSYYEKGTSYPAPSWDQLIAQLPFLRKKLPTYASYAATSMNKLFTMLDTSGMRTLQCKTLNTSFIENTGGGKFQIKALPMEVQFSPVCGMLAEDINDDGNLDVIGVGNFYGSDVVIGRYDANPGFILSGDGKGNFRPLSLTETGWTPDGNAKGLARLESGKGDTYLMVTQNSDSVRIFKYDRSESTRSLKVKPNEGFAIVTLMNGKQRKVEWAYGTSYLSQSSRSALLNRNIRSIQFYKSDGTKTRSQEFLK